MFTFNFCGRVSNNLLSSSYFFFFFLLSHQLFLSNYVGFLVDVDVVIVVATVVVILKFHLQITEPFCSICVFVPGHYHFIELLSNFILIYFLLLYGIFLFFYQEWAYLFQSAEQEWTRKWCVSIIVFHKNKWCC